MKPKWTDTDILLTQIVDIVEDLQEKEEEKTGSSSSDDGEDNDSGAETSSEIGQEHQQ